MSGRITVHDRAALEPEQAIAHFRRRSALPALVAAIARQLTRRGERRVEIIETHYAWVFLTSRLAYKLKKPARSAALDYRSLAARQRGCERELRLNLRLAPNVYQSVVPVTRLPDGQLRLGNGGVVEDFLLKMRRLPRSHSLQSILGSGLSDAQLAALVMVLRRFFENAAARPLAGPAYVRRLRRQIVENRQALRSAPLEDPAMVMALTEAQQALTWHGNRVLSIRGAHLVDGHGDLRCEHIFFGRGVAVIDCLEFSRELRRLDPMQEIARLALEIDMRGQHLVARRLLRAYRESAGETIGAAEIFFYRSHAACTLAKLAAWHAQDAECPDAGRWVDRADEYLQYGWQAIQRARRALRSRASLEWWSAFEQLRRRASAG